MVVDYCIIGSGEWWMNEERRARLRNVVERLPDIYRERKINNHVQQDDNGRKSRS